MDNHTQQEPTLEDIKQARQRLHGVIQETPLDYSATFSRFSDNEIYLKLENLQKTGSFKLRGAFNKIATLSDAERARGVIAASAGNHAQGVAYAARDVGAPCTIVMPEGASLAKISATQRYGAKVVLSGNSYDDAYGHARELSQEHGYTYVHAFDDPAIISGQGTIGLEILDQLPQVNAIVIPMGGGGLAAGIALAVKTLRPDVKIYGVEASAVASFRHALDAGHLETIDAKSTIADGIAVRRPGDIPYALATRYIDDIVTVEEEEISRSMVLLLERCKLVAEGAAGACIAAAIHKKIPNNLGNVVCILSGGNVDVTVLSRIIEHGLIESNRYLRMAVTLDDRPGSLRDLLDIVATLRANVLSVNHHRVGTHIHLGQTEVELDLETRDKAHIDLIYNTLTQAGYEPVARN
ncbi:threonine ammonia-lyase [Alicyclobacillus dauci]|uniref:L-threonine dehydratase catabolic TdcB n=1 Tax=Alicyclobacillus dauci TaxID=1475485 RepID=A0ABY6Z8M3_9BACL|nr:threonine ammonia-lyase [Alicyclobacillus dauci]WAH38917.1 threonine ammonia-lyase [Alicyclobacillus dauci]